MKRGKSQFRRLLELDAQIRGGRYPNCLTFAEEWEVSQKTIQRDIDFLRDSLNAPITYDRNHKGFFYEDTNWFLPSLALSEGELVALLLAVRNMGQYEGSPVASLLQKLADKLEDLLPEKISVRPELVYSRFSFRGPPAKPISADVWTVVVRGLLTQRVLRFGYRAFEAKTERQWSICPLHLANLQGEWYLFGSCEGDKEVLQFALPRMRSAKLTEMHFEMPPDFDAEKMLDLSFGRFAVGEKPFKVRLLFDKDVAEWVTERQWHPKQKAETRHDGRIELTFEARGLVEVKRWVLSWGGSVKVLEPKLLREELRREASAMARP